MTIDANIIILLLDGNISIIQRMREWRQSNQPLFLSTVAEAEVLAYPKYNPIQRRDVEVFMDGNFTSIPFDRAVARIAAEIRRDTKIKLPDAAIAATAFYTHTPVVTRNVQDFRRILNLEVIDIK